MSATRRFLLLTDTEDDPLLVHLAQVTVMQVHSAGGTAITFVNREVAVVQESLETIATWLAAIVMKEE